MPWESRREEVESCIRELCSNLKEQAAACYESGQARELSPTDALVGQLVLSRLGGMTTNPTHQVRCAHTLHTPYMAGHDYMLIPDPTWFVSN